MKQPSPDPCDVCGVGPYQWCHDWCSEQPNPATRKPDKDTQIATLQAERNGLHDALSATQRVAASRAEIIDAQHAQIAALRSALKEACEIAEKMCTGGNVTTRDINRVTVELRKLAEDAR